MRGIIWLVVVMFFTPVFAYVPVEINGDASDVVGSKILYNVREDIRKSTYMGLFFKPDQPRIQIHFLTIDPNENKQNAGISTVYSCVITWAKKDREYPLYVTSFVGICGESRMEGCAEDIVSRISREADNMHVLGMDRK